MWALVAVAALSALCGQAAGGAQLDPDMLELARAVRDGCVADSGVGEDVLARVDAGAELPPEPLLKCYLKCTMETAGMMDAGAVDVEAVVALLPDDLRATMEPNLRACGTQPGADHCDTAYRTQLCWQRADPDNFIFI